MDLRKLLGAVKFLPRSIESPDSWCGHLPFAAWLIHTLEPKIFVELGTHSGNSYFSFCQAVFEDHLETKCYAVDTWQGDEHAGNYGEEVFDQVNIYNQSHYAGFSRLLRMKFDEAVSYFSDGTIGLLHIDGLHTYETVKHDFETWLPKLAPGAVVLFHDTNVRERGFGVWKLWEELQSLYPNNLEFLHSHGLGVLQIDGPRQGKELVWLDPNFADQQLFRDYFSSLGARQLEKYNYGLTKNHITNLTQIIADRDGQIAGLTQTIADRDGQIAGLTLTIADRDGQIADRDGRIADRDGRIAGLTQTIADRDGRIAGLTQAIAEHEAHIHRLNQTVDERNAQHTGLEQAVAERDLRIASLDQAAVDRDLQIGSLNKAITDLRREMDGILNSLSWRLTRPLRSLRIIKGTILWITLDVLVRFLQTRSLAPFRLLFQYVRLRKTPLFDRNFYLKTYPDVAGHGLDPVWHYLTNGSAEGRNPNGNFNTSFYLQYYPDVAASKFNPLYHFIQYGLGEGSLCFGSSINRSPFLQYGAFLQTVI